MKVAVVAVGDLARYFVDELKAQNHQMIAISRSRKPYLDDLGIAQHATDYSASDLQVALADCDAAICTLRGGVPEFASIHNALLEACQRSPKCKRLIPSAWGGNLEEFPDEPLGWADELQTVVQALNGQTEVSWTAICPGWYADYILPANQRYLGSVGEIWPQNYEDKVFTLYGKGSQLVNLTSARDTARATIMLLKQDRNTWENYTYVSGAQMSWRELGDFIRERDPEYTFRRKSLAQSIKQYMAHDSPHSNTVAMFELWAHSEALHFPWNKVERNRAKYFEGMAFRTLRELADEAAAEPSKVV